MSVYDTILIIKKFHNLINYLFPEYTLFNINIFNKLITQIIYIVNNFKGMLFFIDNSFDFYLRNRLTLGG